MTLKAVVDSLDGIDESLHPLYVEKNGKFRLDVEGVEFPDEVAALRKALATERDAGRDARGQLKAFEGVTPEALQEFRDWQKQREQLEAEQQRKAGDWEAREQQILEKHKAQVEKLTGREKKLLTALERAMIKAEAEAAIAELEGSSLFLMPHVERRAILEETDNGFTVRVNDEAGHQMLDDDAKPLTVRGLIEGFKANEKYGNAFKAAGSGGSGVPPGKRTIGGKPVISQSEITKYADKVAKGEVVVAME